MPDTRPLTLLLRVRRRRCACVLGRRRRRVLGGSRRKTAHAVTPCSGTSLLLLRARVALMSDAACSRVCLASASRVSDAPAKRLSTARFRSCPAPVCAALTSDREARCRSREACCWDCDARRWRALRLIRRLEAASAPTADQPPHAQVSVSSRPFFSLFLFFFFPRRERAPGALARRDV